MTGRAPSMQTRSTLRPLYDAGGERYLAYLEQGDDVVQVGLYLDLAGNIKALPSDTDLTVDQAPPRGVQVKILNSQLDQT
jgi:hypothetical protein